MKLKSYLSNNGLTGADFAREIGVTQVTISRYICNARFPDPEMIERIAKATAEQVSVADWYEQAAEHRASKQEVAA